MAGYSSTPLAKRLGIKPGYHIKLINPPGYYFDLFPDMPADITINNKKNLDLNFIHFFTKDAKELTNILPQLKEEIVVDGIIWISWPKKSAKVATDVTEDLIRNTALAIGLVDVKVCVVDDIWSGLKLVIPVKDRKKK